MRKVRLSDWVVLAVNAGVLGWIFWVSVN